MGDADVFLPGIFTGPLAPQLCLCRRGDVCMLKLGCLPPTQTRSTSMGRIRPAPAYCIADGVPAACEPLPGSMGLCQL